MEKIIKDLSKELGKAHYLELTHLVCELSFEDAYKQLSELVKKMESGEMPLADSVAAYEQGKKYEYKSHGQKKYEKKYNSLNQKIKDNKDSYDKKQLLRKRNKLDKIKNKLETYKARDKNRVDYAKTANLGKSILKTVLFGVIGTGNYNRLRSAGQNRIVSALGGSLLGTFIAPVGIGLSKAVENTAGRSRAQGEGKYKKKSNKFDRVLN